MRQYQRQKIPNGRGVHPFIRWIWRRINLDEWSQEDLAIKAGVSSNTIRKWRRGERNPRISELEAVINAMGYRLKIVEGEENA